MKDLFTTKNTRLLEFLFQESLNRFFVQPFSKVFFLFLPLPGEIIQFDELYFCQMGWNHQLDDYYI